MSTGLTIGESIQRVQSLYSKGVKSQDSRLSSRHTYSSLLSARSTITKQQRNKKQKISDFTYQVLPCVELEKAPVNECPCIPQAGCWILRTKYELPVAMTDLDDMMIRSVTTLDGITTIDPTSYKTIKYQAGKKYTADKPSYYIRNKRLYVSNRQQLKAITIDGLWDDPIEVKQFPSFCGPCDDCACIDIMDYEFPVDRDSLRAVIQLASNELIILFGQMKEDKMANASDDIALGNQMIHQPNEQP